MKLFGVEFQCNKCMEMAKKIDLSADNAGKIEITCNLGIMGCK